MRNFLVMTTLSLTTMAVAFAQSTPFDLKRSELEVEKGSIAMRTANASANVGSGSSTSEINGVSYTIRDVQLKAGTKLIIGEIDQNLAYGVAISPDLKLNFRLDENGNIK